MIILLSASILPLILVTWKALRKKGTRWSEWLLAVFIFFSWLQPFVPQDPSFLLPNILLLYLGTILAYTYISKTTNWFKKSSKQSKV
ncbi:MAG: hypothetical protein JNJ45_10075 [Chthonomonas sp.]|nr:hypothetical protein [Chthonomonas sp.]